MLTFQSLTLWGRDRSRSTLMTRIPRLRLTRAGRASWRMRPLSSISPATPSGNSCLWLDPTGRDPLCKGRRRLGRIQERGSPRLFSRGGRTMLRRRGKRGSPTSQPAALKF